MDAQNQPYLFWLKAIEIGDKWLQPEDLYRGEFFQDRLVISDDQGECVYAIDLRKIWTINHKGYKGSNHAEISLVGDPTKIKLWLIDPFFPNHFTYQVSKEILNLMKVYQALKMDRIVELDKNPYIRDGRRYFKNLDGLDVNLPPNIVYKQYVQKEFRLVMALLFTISGLIVGLGLYLDYILN